MEPRMTNPGVSVPGAMDALQALSKAANDAANAAGVPRAAIELIGLRASQEAVKPGSGVRTQPEHAATKKTSGLSRAFTLVGPAASVAFVA